MAELKVYNCHNSTAIFCIDDFYKVSDVEPILNSLQQLKAEIRAMCIELECTTHEKFDLGMYHALRGRLRELSAI